MKRLKINSILLAALLSLGMQACKKTVDKLPTDFINEQNVFQTVTDLEQGLLAAYGTISGENNMYVNAIVADETKISNENRGQGQFEFKWQYVPAQGGSASGSWSNLYQVIGRINKELAVFDNVTPANAAETTKKEQIRGELLAIRALCHFYLVQGFGGSYVPNAPGVPYTTTSDIAARPSRQTIGEVVTGIETDLAAANNTPLTNAPVALKYICPDLVANTFCAFTICVIPMSKTSTIKLDTLVNFNFRFINFNIFFAYKSKKMVA